jgi:hypothetical protein
MADDLFGFLNPNVPRTLLAPAIYAAVHKAGMSWAKQGDKPENTSWLTVDQWNHVVAQFRGLGALDGVDVSDVAASSPLLLQTFIVRAIEAVLSGIDLGDDYQVMRKADYDADLDGKVDLAAGGTGVAASDLADLLDKIGVTSAIATAIAALGAVVVNKGSWDASAGTFPGGAGVKNGWAYIVGVAGTVGGVDFNVGDRALAITDNPSTSTYAANWLKLDYTDQVLSVAGLQGAITAAALRTALSLAAVATSGSASDLSAGTLSDARLPVRIGGAALNISDWNNASSSGWFWAAAAANAPTPTDLFLGVVDVLNVNYATQTVWEVTSGGAADTKAYRRSRTAGNVWSAWYRIRISEAEQAALWVAKATDSALTAGYTATAVNDGTKSSGTYTPSPAGGNLRRIVNGGAFTLAAPSVAGDYTMVIQITNNGSAGAITLSGFSRVAGESFTTVNGDDFLVYIAKVNGFTHATVVALQ